MVICSGVGTPVTRAVGTMRRIDEEDLRVWVGMITWRLIRWSGEAVNGLKREANGAANSMISVNLVQKISLHCCRLFNASDLTGGVDRTSAKYDSF